jgi:hypothetical protein
VIVGNYLKIRIYEGKLLLKENMTESVQIYKYFIYTFLKNYINIQTFHNSSIFLINEYKFSTFYWKKNKKRRRKLKRRCKIVIESKVIKNKRYIYLEV